MQEMKEMSESFDDDYSSDQATNEPDWDEYVFFEEEQKTHHLEGKDYVALFIAAIQTIFLPLIILAFVLFIAGLILTSLI